MSHRSALRTAVRAVACTLAVVTLFATLAAQAVPAAQSQPDVTRPSPLQARGLDASTGLPLFAPSADDVRALAELSAQPGLQVRLTDFALGAGRTVALDLTAFDLDGLRLGFRVDGLPAPKLLDGLELSVWTGAIAGEPGSEALLALSAQGVWGWVRGAGDAPEQTVHVLSRPEGGDWSFAPVVLATEQQLAERGQQPGPLCATEGLAARLAPPAADARKPSGPSKSGAADGAPDCSHWECPIAMETDFQLFQLFNNLGAETAYVTALLAAVSGRYVEQIDTELVFPYVQLYTTAADPWTTPDVGGDSISMLDEFQQAWQGALPAGAKLGHMMSGANLGGGVAYLAVLGDSSQTFTFGVSGNIDGDTPFPIAVSPLNWDFMVVAHELGHNFSSPHTHDFVPPIDECANGICITDGTIMSYCHLCPGGLSNITTFFHPLCVDLMVSHAGDNLPLVAPLVASAATQPTLIQPFTATLLTVEVQGTPIGPVLLNYRFSPAGSFLTKPMTAQGGGMYGTNLPAAQCGDSPEWFFSMNDSVCGPFSSQTFVAGVGNVTTLVADDFEIDTGWTAGLPGDTASSGLWERGDPIGTGAQPEDDFSNPGTLCFFTGQGPVGGGLGDNDVDNGHTTLVSPPIDLSSGDARIAYWRWYSNDAGSTPNTDIFEVEISNNGSTWVNVETVGPAGEGTSGLWFRHEFLVSDFVAPNATVRVRFIAADEDSGSLVEAAIDDFEVFRVECGELCQANLGFGGPGTASLSVCGGDLSAGTTAMFTLTGATPGGTAFLFAGLTFAPTPAKGGVLVPVPPTLKLIVPLNGAGAFSDDVPGGHGPVSVYVQAVYTAPLLPAPHWGFSNALRVDLLP